MYSQPDADRHEPQSLFLQRQRLLGFELLRRLTEMVRAAVGSTVPGDGKAT